MQFLETKNTLTWHKVGRGFYMDIPEHIRKNPPFRYAWTIKMEQAEK